MPNARLVTTAVVGVAVLAIAGGWYTMRSRGRVDDTASGSMNAATTASVGSDCTDLAALEDRALAAKRTSLTPEDTKSACAVVGIIPRAVNATALHERLLPPTLATTSVLDTVRADYIVVGNAALAVSQSAGSVVAFDLGDSTRTMLATVQPPKVGGIPAIRPGADLALRCAFAQRNRPIVQLGQCRLLALSDPATAP